MRLMALATARVSLVARRPPRVRGPRRPATAAVVCHRAAKLRGELRLLPGLPLMEEALRLYEQAPPSSDHAEALLDYANTFLLYLEERPEAGVRVVASAQAEAQLDAGRARAAAAAGPLRAAAATARRTPSPAPRPSR